MAEVIDIVPFIKRKKESSQDEFEEVTKQITTVLELSTDELIIELTERIQATEETMHASLSVDLIIDELCKRHFYLNNLIATASIMFADE